MGERYCWASVSRGSCSAGEVEREPTLGAELAQLFQLRP